MKHDRTHTNIVGGIALHFEPETSSEQTYQTLRREAIRNSGHLRTVRLIEETPYGTLNYLVPLHDEDMNTVNRCLVQNYRDGAKVGLAVGTVTTAFLGILFLLLTS